MRALARQLAERVVSYRLEWQPEFQRSNVERRTITCYER
jgi:hypothetical protein